MAGKNYPVIAWVGGGSYNWAPHIMRDIMLTEGLGEAEFRLLDINPDAAGDIAALGRKMSADFGIGAKLTPMTNQARALDGADFVLITISTGGIDATAYDLKIPDRYGILQPVGDTVGPGGWARGLRNFEVFRKLGADCRRYCPQAAILNYSNPMSVLTKVLTVETPQPVVGLCHGVFQNIRELMRIFGLKNESELDIHYAGLNHFFVVLDFKVRGRSGYPALRRKMGKKSYNSLLRERIADEMGWESDKELCDELFEIYGKLFFSSDRHTCEFVNWCICHGEKRMKQYKLVRTTAAQRRKRAGANKKMVSRLARSKKPEEKRRSRETAADIMRAIALGDSFVDVVNLPNIGQVSNLPLGVVVETPGTISPLGFTPHAMGALPEEICGLMLPHARNFEYIVEACYEGDLEKAFLALQNDPCCQHLPRRKVREMGLSLLKAHRSYLPKAIARNLPNQG